uniref:Uncharacterized protein n=1 Tax=Nicotiana tabacum TaxID=4097 RepID=A0A1S4AHQ0_TOBAC|nr:PREDICTED: uncharacterized protein LOC107797774 [Nicotiana tabacum]
MEHVPNFRDWVDSILKIAPMEARTWKSISLLNGWKVKTHGFGIRGMTAEVAVAIRASSTASLDLEKTRATLPKRKVVEESSENEEEENTSLIARPRARRRVIDGDEVEDTPARASISEPVQILSDEDTTPRGSNESIRRLFVSGFESGEFGPVLDETPLSSSIPISSIPSIPLTTTSISLPILSTLVSLPVLVPISAPTVPALTPTAPIVFTSSTTPPSIVPPPSVQHTEAGSSSRGMAMRSVTLEVPANHSLLRKTGGADVWLEPLIGDIEKKKMESHSCLTLMNDIVHSTLKANLIGTELMGRISTLEKKDRESAKAISEARRIAKETQLEAANWKEQISSDEIRALKSSHASLEASLDSHLAEHQILKNDLAMWEREYGLLEENFNIELLNEEVATAAIGVAIPAPEGETSMTQTMEAEAPVALASLGDFNTPGPVETALIFAPSEVVTVPVTAPENEIATFDVPTPSVTS